MFPLKKYSSWRGKVLRKSDVLGKYRFGFCYEILREIQRLHITEKIFDVMMAGTVPVYLGPKNASKYPTRMSSLIVLISDHMSLLSLGYEPKLDTQEYLEAINGFSSVNSHEFSIDCFVDRILNALIGRRG